MAFADKYAENANPKGIALMNYITMSLLGLIFAIVVTLFFIGGSTFGSQVVALIPTWLMSGLSAVGGMMRYVGFSILIRVMVYRELWGFFFVGFAMAVIIAGITSLSGSAMVILALIGFGIAYWDFQIQTKLSKANSMQEGDFEDGI